jgi:hypothetical protein
MRARRKGEAHRRPAGREVEPLRGRGGSGARPLAARLFRWTGAENVEIGGRSCGAFKAPRRTFVRSEDCPHTGAGNISPVVDEITLSGFPFPNRSDGRNCSGGNDSTGAERGAAKKAARLFPLDRSWKRRNRRQELRRV